MALFDDIYFTRSRMAAKKAAINPIVLWQIFNKKEAVLCGNHFVENLFKDAEILNSFELHLLPEGSITQPLEPVMYLKGHYQDLVRFETEYLGNFAYMTRIATNVNNAVKAAKGKPVLFFPARFSLPETQFKDGYAAGIGGAAGCSTVTQMHGWNLATHEKNKPSGTQSHASICCFDGDVVASSLATYEANRDVPMFSLVDYYNDCTKTAVEVFKAFKQKGYKLDGVRLDTSEKMVDKSLNIVTYQDADEVMKFYKEKGYTGVNPQLVKNVRKALDEVGGNEVKICVSGGFTPEKIKIFEDGNVPVDVYAVGEYFFSGSVPFTSDIVLMYDDDGKNPHHCSKVGRNFIKSERLVKVI